MNNTINKENVKLTSALPRVYAETAVEGETLLPDYCPNIMRIVRTEAVPYIRSKTLRGDKIFAEGTVNFYVLYLSENESLLQSLPVSLPFSQNIDAKTDEPASFNVKARISYVNTRALSPQKIYLKATVSLYSDITIENETQMILPCEENKDIFTNNVLCPHYSVVATTERPVKVSDEINVNGRNITQVLRHDVSIIQTECKTMNGKIITKGDLYIKVVFLNGDTCEAEYVTHKSTVSQVLEFNNAECCSFINVDYSVSELRLQVTENSIATERALTFEAEISISAVGYVNSQMNICKDAFASEKMLEKSENQTNFGKIASLEKGFTISESVDVGLYDKIYDVSVSAFTEETEYNSEAGLLNVRGDMLCCVLYKNLEGDIGSCDRQIPFSVQIPVEAGGYAAISSTNVSIIATVFVASDGKTVEVRSEAALHGSIVILNQMKYLSDLQITEKLVKPRSSTMTLYYANSGESLFEIAKKYSVDPQIIKNTNSLQDMITTRQVIIV